MSDIFDCTRVVLTAEIPTRRACIAAPKSLYLVRTPASAPQNRQNRDSRRGQTTIPQDLQAPRHGTLLSRYVRAEQPIHRRPSPTGPETTLSTPTIFHQPTTVEEVQQVVKSCTKLRALGARHSFNGIADSTENQISLKQLHQIDPRRQIPRRHRRRRGNLWPASPLLSTPAASPSTIWPRSPTSPSWEPCATATHGSGSNNGNLSTAVSAIEFVTADGSIRHLSRAKDGDNFLGAIVNLGALGVVTRITLDVQPTFQVAQSVYENLSISQLEHHLDEIFLSGYSISLFTDWQNQRFTQVWIKRRTRTRRTHNLRARSSTEPPCHKKSPPPGRPLRRKLHRTTRTPPAPGTSASHTSR